MKIVDLDNEEGRALVAGLLMASLLWIATFGACTCGFAAAVWTRDKTEDVGAGAPNTEGKGER